MKKQFLFMSAIALISLSTSCSKDDILPKVSDPTQTDPPQTDPPGTNPSTAVQPVTPVINGVNGTLVSVIMAYSYTNDLLPMPMTVVSDIAVAAFPASNGSDMVSAGTVSVNNIDLEKADNNAYYITATEGMTPSSLGFDGISVWDVTGSANVSGFSYSHTVSFPDFSGTLPTTITKSNGITIDLNGDVSSADSVYLVVAAGNTYVQTAVGGGASSISLSSAELQSLPTVSDNSGIIQIVPFRVTLETISGNQYAFVKQKAVVSSININ